jgi:hypothetical protein
MVVGAVDGRRWQHAEDRSGQEGAKKERYVHAHNGLFLWGFVAHGGGGLGGNQWKICRRERRWEMRVREEMKWKIEKMEEMEQKEKFLLRKGHCGFKTKSG